MSSCCCDAITEFKVDFKAFNDMHVKHAACFSLTPVNGIVQVTLGLNLWVKPMRKSPPKNFRSEKLVVALLQWCECGGGATYL